MSSYLEKYHLQKVEPVRNRTTQGELYKPRPKNEKSTSMKIQYKPKSALHRKHLGL